MYWGLEWWAWAGIGAALIVVALGLARVLFRAFVHVGELKESLERAREELDGAMSAIRDESERARERMEVLRERRAEESDPPAANPFQG